MTETGAPTPALSVEVEQAKPMRLSGSFTCSAGEVLALVGPSGAGKTSLLRVMAGLMQPAQGRVVVGGEVWCDTARGVFLPPQQRHVGLVFQSYALMPHLDALGNVALSLLHLPRRERRERARHWLAHVGLTGDQQERRPAALSGGQQQRVGVARALAREPRLLLLDEPFSAVDQMSRQGLYRLLADLRRELSIPIVLVTHDLDEARMLADTLVVVDAGVVLQQGAPAWIHRAPRNARVADLVGIQNRFRGRWLGPGPSPGVGRLCWLAPGEEPVEGPVLLVRDKGRINPGQAVSWVVPGEGIELLRREPAGPGELAATLGQARHLGEITLVVLEFPALPGVRMQLTLSGQGRLECEAGAPLTVRLDVSQIHVMPFRVGGGSPATSTTSPGGP
jgi:molybdate transport system ATP-binding protein